MQAIKIQESLVSPREMEGRMKRGCLNFSEVSALYEQRMAFVETLRVKGGVTVDDLGKLDRLGRCDVANQLWSVCTQAAKDALLADAQHQVRSCSVLARAVSNI